MNRVLALTAGVLVALVSTSAASAGEVPAGKAYGNCKHSSAVGNPHTALLPEIGSGKGNGGLVQVAKSGTGCVATVGEPGPTAPPSGTATPPAEVPTGPGDAPTTTPSPSPTPTPTEDVWAS